MRKTTAEKLRKGDKVKLFITGKELYVTSPIWEENDRIMMELSDGKIHSHKKLK